jgi:hypothetical protein
LHYVGPPQRHYAVEGRVEMKEVAACEPAVHADAAESGLRRRSRQECDDGGDNAGRARSRAPPR